MGNFDNLQEIIAIWTVIIANKSWYVKMVSVLLVKHTDETNKERGGVICHSPSMIIPLYRSL